MRIYVLLKQNISAFRLSRPQYPLFLLIKALHFLRKYDYSAFIARKNTLEPLFNCLLLRSHSEDKIVSKSL